MQNNTRDQQQEPNFTEVDYSVCMEICMRYPPLCKLQSVSQDVALKAIMCIYSATHEIDDGSIKRELEEWHLMETVEFVRQCYGPVSDEDVEQPIIKKTKLAQTEHAHPPMNVSKEIESFNGALPLMKSLIEKDLTSYDELVLALHQVHKHRLVDSLPHFRRCFRKNPYLHQFYYHVIELHKLINHKIEPIKIMKQGQLNFKRRLNQLGRLRETITDEKSKKYLDTEIATCQSHLLCLGGLVLFFCDCCNPVLMMKCFEDALAVDNSNIYAHLNMGFLKGYNSMMDRETSLEGIEHFREAIKTCPKSEEVIVKATLYRALANISAMLGNMEEALSSYEKALEINPYYFSVLKERAEVLSIFDLEGAITDIRMALSVSPKVKTSVSNAYIIYALLLQKLNRDNTEILSLMETAKAIDCSNPYPFLALSSVAIEKQDIDMYTTLRSEFVPKSHEAICDLLDQDIKAFEVFDPIYQTNMFNELKMKKQQYYRSWTRIS